MLNFDLSISKEKTFDDASKSVLRAVPPWDLVFNFVVIALT
jgi:hypothetical protein